MARVPTRSAHTEETMRLQGRCLALLALPALLAAGGCGGPATFVSTEPPPDSVAEAWFGLPVTEVRAAVRQAMLDGGLVIDQPASDATTVVGTRQQVPYVGEGAGELAGGPLPLYRVKVVLSRDGRTHVRATAHAVCPTCDGATPYEWEYPGDLVRDILEGAHRRLGDPGARFNYPPRFRPARWRPPRPHR